MCSRYVPPELLFASNNDKADESDSNQQLVVQILPLTALSEQTTPLQGARSAVNVAKCHVGVFAMQMFSSPRSITSPFVKQKTAEVAHMRPDEMLLNTIAKKPSSTGSCVLFGAGTRLLQHREFINFGC